MQFQKTIFVRSAQQIAAAFAAVSVAAIVASLLLPFSASAATVISFTTTGTTSWTAPCGVTAVDYLVVAGGGGGAGGAYSGGGGAGGMRTGTLSVTPGNSYTVTVGAGGAAVAYDTQGNNGSDSVFGSITSTGGGGGGHYLNAGSSGGSGGGGGWDTVSGLAGGAGTAGQGNNGGNGLDYAGGGGGGAGAVGQNAYSFRHGGNGGAGVASSITGSSVTYGGGGGGAGAPSGSKGLGGAGGGGNGGEYDVSTASTAGTANTGGGGGGGGPNTGSSGAAGGSGIVVLSYTQGSTAGCLTITNTATSTVIRGDFYATGTLTKGSGTFVIDHPLDPANKLLYHAFVESDEATNLYDGIATLDRDGHATITLPDYFLVLNKDFSYLTTPLGAPMPNLHLVKGVHHAWFFGLFGPIVFDIGGGVPNGRISWQVTGVRHDPFILAHPTRQEVEKGPNEIVNKGEYLCPECYASSTRH